MKLFWWILTTLFLASCGRTDFATLQGATVTTTATNTSTNTSTATSTGSQPTTIQGWVQQFDAYLASIGQPNLQPGLSCNLYTVPTSTTFIAGANLTYAATFTYDQAFDQPDAPVTNGFNVLPVALQQIYQTWFIMKCYGNIVVPQDGYHQFSLTSDDGSNLYIDGLLTVNNDGLHSAQTIASSVSITAGVHYFELDFFQATGNQALILNEDGQLMDPGQFYFY